MNRDKVEGAVKDKTGKMQQKNGKAADSSDLRAKSVSKRMTIQKRS